MSTVSSRINHGITLGNPGYYSPLTVTTTGYISNAGTGVAVYDATAGYTLVNYGGISATGTYAAVNSINGGSVDNIGSISGASGVVLGGPGTVTNSGVLSAYAATAVQLSGGGNVTNLSGGLITATGGSLPAVQVSNGSGAATITNYGTISGSEGVYAGANAAQTLIDSGTIIGSGGTAVALGAGTGLVQFRPGNLLMQGTVTGGGIERARVRLGCQHRHIGRHRCELHQFRYRNRRCWRVVGADRQQHVHRQRRADRLRHADQRGVADRGQAQPERRTTDEPGRAASSRRRISMASAERPMAWSTRAPSTRRTRCQTMPCC